MSINVAIIGSTGYTGTELVKILIDHPKVNLKSLSSENWSLGAIAITW